MPRQVLAKAGAEGGFHFTHGTIGVDQRWWVDRANLDRGHRVGFVREDREAREIQLDLQEVSECREDLLRFPRGLYALGELEQAIHQLSASGEAALGLFVRFARFVELGE